MNELIKKKLDVINRMTNLDMYNQAIIELYLTVNLDLIRKVEIFTAYEMNEHENELKGIVSSFERAYNDQSVLYSKLEKNLIDALKNHKIIDNHFFQKYSRLRTIRNYCAHPSIKGEGFYDVTYYELMDMIQFFNENLFSQNEFFCYKSEDIPNMLKNEVYSSKTDEEQLLYCDHKYKIYSSANSFYLLKTLKNLLLLSISKEYKNYHVTCCLNIRAISNILCERNTIKNFDFQIIKTINHSDIDIFSLSGFYELINGGIDHVKLEDENTLLYNLLKTALTNKYYFQYIISIGEKILDKNLNEIIYEDEFIGLNNLKTLSNSSVTVDFERYINIMAMNANDYDKNDELCETIINFKTNVSIEFIEIMILEKMNDSQFKDRNKYEYHMNQFRTIFPESSVFMI